MNDANLRIFALVAEKKATPEEGLELLEAMERPLAATDRTRTLELLRKVESGELDTRRAASLLADRGEEAPAPIEADSPASISELIPVAIVALAFLAVQLAFSPRLMNIVLPKVAIAEIAGVICLGAWLLTVARRGGGWRIGIAGYSALGFLAYMAVRSLGAKWEYAAWLQVGWWLPLALLVPMLADLIRTERAARIMISSMSIATIAQSAYVVLQAVGLDPLSAIGWTDWGKNTVVGTHGNPMFTAAALLPVTVLLSVVAAGFLRATMRGNTSQISMAIVSLAGAVFGLIGFAVAVTHHLDYARAQLHSIPFAALVLGGIAVAFGYILIFVGRSWPRTLVISATLGVVVLIIGSAETASGFFDTARAAAVREVINDGADRLIAESPLVGHGPGSFAIEFPRVRATDYSRRGVSHNTREAFSEPREILVDGGILAGILWCLLIGACLASAASSAAYGDTPIHQSLGVGTLGAITAGLVFSLFENELRWMGPAYAFWTVLGIAASLPQLGDFPPPTWPKSARRFVGTAAAAILLIGIPIAGFASYRGIRASYLLAEAQAFEGMPEAIPRLEEATRLNPWDPSTLYKLAYLYLVAGRTEDALESYRALQTLAPDYAQIHWNLAFLLKSLGRDSEALAEIERQCQLQENVEPHRIAAEHYQEAGRKEDVRRHLEAILAIDADDRNGKGSIRGFGHDEARAWLARLSANAVQTDTTKPVLLLEESKGTTGMTITTLDPRHVNVDTTTNTVTLLPESMVFRKPGPKRTRTVWSSPTSLRRQPERGHLCQGKIGHDRFESCARAIRRILFRLVVIKYEPRTRRGCGNGGNQG